MTSRALPPIRRTGRARLPTPWGTFTCETWQGPAAGALPHGVTSAAVASETAAEHIVLWLGALDAAQPPLVRLHSECATGDLFRSLRCDCGAQLELALQRIGEAGRGVLIYLRGHEGRGIGLAAKLAAYELQDQGLDTVEANTQLGHPVDARDYRAAAAILQALGVQRLHLMSNNPRKAEALEAAGIDVVSRSAHEVAPNEVNRRYLATKRDRMGHLLDF